MKHKMMKLAAACLALAGTKSAEAAQFFEFVGAHTISFTIADPSTGNNSQNNFYKFDNIVASVDNIPTTLLTVTLSNWSSSTIYLTPSGSPIILGKFQTPPLYTPYTDGPLNVGTFQFFV